MPKHARLLAKALQTSGGNPPIVPVRSASFQAQSPGGRRAHLSHRRGFTHGCHDSCVGSPSVVSTVVAWREGTQVQESVEGPPGGAGRPWSYEWSDIVPPPYVLQTLACPRGRWSCSQSGDDGLSQMSSCQ